MTDDIKIIHFLGWHGTDVKNVEEILKGNFKESQGDHHWLGQGVYFFVEGIGDPVKHAENWVRSESHSRGNLRFAVLKANTAVNDDAILDLRQDAGITLFNVYKEHVLRELRRTNREFRIIRDGYRDGKVIEHMKQSVGLEVVVMNLYVRFLRDRVEQISSKVPNCTFLCVSNPEENINLDSIKVETQGNI